MKRLLGMRLGCKHPACTVDGCRGFSLIEVNMAVLVMAVGVLALMGLFPSGLRESMQNRADLKQAMFAGYVLALAQAEAASATPNSQVPGQFKSTGGLGPSVSETQMENYNTLDVKKNDVSFGSSGTRDKGQYRLLVFDERHGGKNFQRGGVFLNADAQEKTYLQVVAVQSSELPIGLFRSNPIFFVFPMAWNYEAMHN